MAQGKSPSTYWADAFATPVLLNVRGHLDILQSSKAGTSSTEGQSGISRASQPTEEKSGESRKEHCPHACYRRQVLAHCGVCEFDIHFEQRGERE